MNPQLSVIVQTSPGRERLLSNCLHQLMQQTLSDFEVLVIDDGSKSGKDICQTYKELKLKYYWRNNDCCLSRSRNLGFQHSSSPFLVYIDSDILLNPRALENYRDYLHLRKNTLICGYYGNDRTKVAPSIWYPEVNVNWFDRRFYFNEKNAFVIEKDIMKRPHLYAFGGNFALEKKFYETLGGFDENFVGWGCEDIDFANRLLLAKGSIHFSLDVWGEHQCHPTREKFHQISAHQENVQIKEKKIENLLPSSLKNRVIMAKERKVLSEAIFEHYIPNNKYHKETTEFEMTKAIIHPPK